MFKNELNTSDKDFDSDLSNFIDNRGTFEREVVTKVAEIISEVERKGDQALISLTKELDRHQIEDFFISDNEIDACVKNVEKEVLSALEFACKNIIDYHSSCRDSLHLELSESQIHRKFRPIKSVLMYVPGGKASYPSSVLMAAGPAIACNINDLYLTTPCIGGDLNNLTIAAAKIAGIRKIAKLGGAQAIAAFALGTESIPEVDKIVGPGNSYVTEAKRQLFGRVGIDGIAGPSEILVLADETSCPETVAWDLMAQAEHDEEASSILLCSSEKVIQKIKAIIDSQIDRLERSEIIRSALKENGLIIKIDSLDQSLRLINILAPEHLHIAFANNNKIDTSQVVAGIILEGPDSAVSLSDYVLGPSHILPTNSSSRFSSPLSVEDFMVSSSHVSLKYETNPDLYIKYVENTSIIARAEGLTAHAISVEKRKKV